MSLLAILPSKGIPTKADSEIQALPALLQIQYTAKAVIAVAPDGVSCYNRVCVYAHALF